MKNEVISKREMQVVKSNDLIRTSRHSFNLQQQKALLYIISQMKPGFKEFSYQEFEINEFCDICGIERNNGKNFKDLKDGLQGLRDKSMWVKLENGKTILTAWLLKVEIDDNCGTVGVMLDKELEPFLLELQKNFTTYNLIWTLRMKSKYSIRLYELLKSYENLHEDIIFTVEQLKERIGAEYDKWYDLKRKCIEVAIKEINAQTDISVIYSIEKRGKAVNKVIFKIQTKGTADQMITKVKANAELNMKKIGQRAVEVMKDTSSNGNLFYNPKRPRKITCKKNKSFLTD